MPRELAYDLAALALYDIVIYCDDSGSMTFEENGGSVPGFVGADARLRNLRMSRKVHRGAANMMPDAASQIVDASCFHHFLVVFLLYSEAGAAICCSRRNSPASGLLLTKDSSLQPASLIDQRL